MGETTNIFETHFANQQTVFLDRNAISPHFMPNKFPFREKQIHEISQIFSTNLNQKKSDNLFLYGKTGTGKTSVTRLVLRQLLEFAGKQNLPINGTYINCRNHNSKYRVLSKVVKELFPEENFLGYSAAFIYDKVMDGVNKKKTNYLIVLDEIDKVKDLDDLVYALTRSNDELENGSVSVVGISNNVFFKERLDPRTKSSLCQHEMIFPPYNAEELNKILDERAELAFKPKAIEESAINLAAAFAAKESGDARTAVMLLLKAGELADKKQETSVQDVHVQKAKKKVEEELILNMIATLPKHQQLLLHTIASLSMHKKSQQRITGTIEELPLFSGEIYEEYAKNARNVKEQPVSARWYREYISELEMFGLILTAASGHGIRGNTRLIRLSFDAKKIKEALEKQFENA
ncbi:AAA family ATPase [Candidatus Micrarchaeota archaeon]|nr:AAA family ATPase [Candidatus Micrarchaeota archaeon]MBU1930020.1 AAA family ATPase [Candidatus Micrarchaeota archaeon]